MTEPKTQKARLNGASDAPGPIDASLELLDNPVWHALRGPLERFAEVGTDRRARRFSPEVSFFAAVDGFDEASWASQAELAGPGGVSVLFRDEVPPAPHGWTEVLRVSGYQMIGRKLPDPPDLDVTHLAAADSDEVMALIALTEPGPFLPRTLELGTYVGIRQEGRLVAMAGERFQVPGWCEVSAVCAHPDVRRQGLGAALTLWVAGHIRAKGDRPLLHVVDTNEGAIRLYQKLGFEIRRKVDVVANQWLKAKSQPARVGP